MKKIFSLLLTLCSALAAFSQTVYQPDGIASFTGAATYCVGAPITTPLDLKFTNCNSGIGAPSGVILTVNWYYNTTNSTSVTGATLVSGPIVMADPTSDTVALSYLPTLTVGGEYYFFCEIRWSGGGTIACGGSSGVITSGTQLVRISPPPIAPSAPINLCETYSATLTNAFAGGTWTSSNTSVATIDTFTGVVYGEDVGATFITYRLGSCYVTSFLTVNALPGNILPGLDTTLCVGRTLTLTNSSVGGTWSSSSASTASVGSASGIVSAFSAGVANISYVLPTGCYMVKPVTVAANPAVITGATDVCVASNTILSNTSSPGAWSSSNTAVGTVNAASGSVRGISAGTTVISFTMTTPGRCYAITTVNVNAAPSATIGGPGTVCQGAAVTLTNAVGGGNWTSGDIDTATVAMSTGVVTGVGPGTVRITYTKPGCGPVSKQITVNPLPGPIMGIFFTCYGQSTPLSVPGSSLSSRWYSADATIAAVDSTSGNVSGISMGVTTISYREVNGCFTTVAVTVHPLAPIVGPDTVCVGSSITLSNVVGGGTWVSSNPDVVTIDTFTGIATGLVDGITFIKYHLPTGCMTTRMVRNLPPLSPIGGSLAICSASSTTLSIAESGGMWFSANPHIAEIDTISGVLIGRNADTTTIYYMIHGCTAVAEVTVNPLPEPTTSYDWLTRRLSTPAIYAGFQWFDSSASGAHAIAGATSSYLTLTDVYTSYYVEATDGNGCKGRSEWFRNPVGVHEAGELVYVRVYPNPATDQVFIASGKPVSVAINSIDGKTIKTARNVSSLDVSSLAPGLYLLGIYDEDGILLKMEKLTKQ
jgi:uncharacterized protein YjdB